MSETAIVPHSETGMSLADAEKLARTIATSGIIPDGLKGKPADVLVILLTGKELGLQPMQAIRSMNVIKGKPVMSADLMIALCKSKSDVCEYFRLVDSSAKHAVYETKRRGDPEPTRLEWTFEDATKAGLTGNDNWKKHTAAMLRARCGSALARAVYPDLMLGVYETDEGEEIQGRAASVIKMAPAPEESGLEARLKASIQANEEKAKAKELVSQAAEVLDGEIVATTPEPAGDLFGLDAEEPASDEYVFTFGKHKGRPISEVPKSYLTWLKEQNPKPDVLAAINAFLGE